MYDFWKIHMFVRILLLYIPIVNYTNYNYIPITYE